ncbi:AGE family epimerase/isomerase [Poritiphilus flavus]|uniref:AGE family epimerase/isomerase n=1 Tax=Poritiphilus flavus TaxID=2697053 RepID=A0A6L9EA48_9FLAO|nr:AGE family epimerase/isomerase [Poritiphilus flavus]NAS11533.1 AGE family epimerase/isomerase [Poritiphilus flavus]
MQEYTDIYKKELLEQIIPFWEAHSLDMDYGGYFSCLTPGGEVYDTDKFLWLQARQLWMFGKLYKEVESRKSWKKIALNGAEFLSKHGRDTEGNWYFSLDRKGNPLVQPYNIFSDCFAAMAFGKLYEIEPRAEFAEIARNTFDNILSRRQNPKGIYTKAFPGTRQLKNFALPMILCNLTLELEPVLGSEDILDFTDELVEMIMSQFLDEKSGLVLENIGPNGEFVNSFEGRLLNPGHAIEAMWFLMNIGLRKNDQDLIAKAEEVMYRQLEHGWDEKYGGLFYFMDIKGHPPQQLEWDQKLWWVHMEALVALAKAYACNGSARAAEWFERVHTYAWQHFRDMENGGEWYGYLNRQGQVLLHLKGGKWKGCFHIPRGMLEIWKTLEQL